MYSYKQAYVADYSVLIGPLLPQEMTQKSPPLSPPPVLNRTYKKQALRQPDITTAGTAGLLFLIRTKGRFSLTFPNYYYILLFHSLFFRIRWFYPNRSKLLFPDAQTEKWKNNSYRIWSERLRELLFREIRFLLPKQLRHFPHLFSHG